MQLLPIKTGLLHPGDSLTEALLRSTRLQEADIIIVSSKAVATAENTLIDLRSITPSPTALEWAAKTGRSPPFCEAVLAETKRLNGKVISHCPGALLTEVLPEGLSRGSIITANAGLDESNAPVGCAIGWPTNPPMSARSLRTALEAHTDGSIAVIISDSRCSPRRLGVTAFALAASGIDPFADQAGKEDLYGRKLHITTEAISDQLATAGNFLMGNAAQATPAVIIRDHGLQMSKFEGWVEGIDAGVDLFRGIL
ncbi:MAG: coenzyme F420-0:L-glutamate ligase [Candidatus Peregrinibacteria bacterium]|nr:coenzyme F420-0:L-glutamate ligase [Candidatus Peregrinibacteria bacterium]